MANAFTFTGRARLFIAGLSMAAVFGISNARAADGPTLREAAKGAFLIGAAVRPDLLQNAKTGDVIARQFDCMTAENVMKPAAVEPQPGQFDFAAGDVIADFAAAHDMRLIGHNLCWHQQTPAWMFQNPDGSPLPREQGLANLRRHITGVLTHFKGKCHGWDVVNEALADEDKLYLRESPAKKCIGDDFVVQAFKIAHEVDPDVELYYNDYNIDYGPKMAKAVRLIGELKAAGCRIDGVGDQAHWQLNWPSSSDIETGITTLAAAGVKVHITELDIDLLPRKGQSANITDVEKANGSTAQNPYVKGLPDELQQKLAERYGTIFGLFEKHKDVIARVTLWGVDDGMSWLNSFPIRGRTNYPLLLDRDMQPKPAFFAVIKALEAK